MAGRIILGLANPSLDANGVIASGSTLDIYQNNTTTPVTIYTAADLLTPQSNPVTCDAAGRFPQIWTDATQAYSVKWTIPGASPITYNDIRAQSYDPDSVITNGVKFPAVQVPSANANTLDDYEEGTWTPVDGSGAGLALTVNSATYVKIGAMVFIAFRILYPVTASGLAQAIAGLPFTSASYGAGGMRVDSSIAVIALNTASTSFAGVNLTNTTVSGALLIGSLMYSV